MGKSSTHEVIVADTEYELCKQFIVRQLNIANDLIDKYSKCMEKVATNSVKAGTTGEAIICFNKYVSQLKEINKIIGQQYSNYSNEFISEIDNADVLLYDANKGAVRSFTSKNKEKLKKLLDETKIYSQGMSRLEVLCSKIIIGLNIRIWQDLYKGAEVTLRQYEQRVRECNEAKKKSVDEIYEEVSSIDTKYSKKMESSIEGMGGCAGFDLTGATINAEIKVLKAMNELLKSGISNFNVNNISLKLEGLFQEMGISLDKLVNVKDTDVIVTIEKIQKFVEIDENKTFYKSYASVLESEYDRIDSGDMALNLLYNGVSVTKEILLGQIFLPEEVKNKSLSEIYDYILIKKQLAEMISKTAGGENLVGEQYVEYKNFLSNYNSEVVVWSYNKVASHNGIYVGAMTEEQSKLYKEGGKWFQRYSKDLKEFNAYYKDFFKAMGYGTDFSRVVAPLFYNYVKEIELIKSVCGNAEKGSLLDIACKDLLNEYKHKFLTVGEEIIKDALSGAMDITEDAISKSINAATGSLLSAAKITSEIYEFLTGFSGSYSSLREFKAIYKINGELQANYTKCFETVKNGGVNINEEQSKNLQNAFNLLKQNYSKEFSYLAEYYSAQGETAKVLYYQHLARQVKALSIANGEPLNSQFKTYKEWIGQ